MDVLLGEADAEKQLLPEAASSKINGFCAAHQKVFVGQSWKAMSWAKNGQLRHQADRVDPWQTLLRFKPEVSMIPPGSTLYVQLMFEELRADWIADTQHVFPSCVASIVHGCASTTYASTTFTLLDEFMTGVNTIPAAIPKVMYDMISDPNTPKKTLQWGQFKDICQVVNSTHAPPDPERVKCLARAWCSPNSKLNSQYWKAGSTRIIPSKLGEYLSGEELSILLKNPIMPHPAAQPSRCAVRGNIHVTYLYRPPGNGPCDGSQN